MSATKQTTIWCDGEDCAVWRSVDVGDSTWARRELRVQGWRTTRNGRDLCPRCANKATVSEGVDE